MTPRDLTLKLTQIFVGLAEIILGLTFIFKLFNADQTNGFVNWIYSMAAPLYEPIRGVFPVVSYSNKYILDLPTLFTIFAYAFAGYLVLVVINVVPKPRDLGGQSLRNRIKKIL